MPVLPLPELALEPEPDDALPEPLLVEPVLVLVELVLVDPVLVLVEVLVELVLVEVVVLPFPLPRVVPPVVVLVDADVVVPEPLVDVEFEVEVPVLEPLLADAADEPDDVVALLVEADVELEEPPEVAALDFTQEPAVHVKPSAQTWDASQAKLCFAGSRSVALQPAASAATAMRT